MFKVGWPLSFCREKPSTKWWWPASYTRILFGSGSFHIFFAPKKIQKPIRTSPSHEALDWPLTNLQKTVSQSMRLPHSHLYKMIWPLIDLQKACSQAIFKPRILYKMVSQPQILACLVKQSSTPFYKMLVASVMIGNVRCKKNP